MKTPQQARAPDVSAASRGVAAGRAGGPLQCAIDASPRVAAQRRRIDALFGPALQRQEATQDDELQQPVQARAGASSSGRTGLPGPLKSGIESLSGLSMDGVRVHYNSDRPAQLSALAYAQGDDIHLGPGQEQHLPHEAWHVVQQAQGRVGPSVQAKGVAINADAGLEQEADLMGARAASLGQTASADAVRQARPAGGSVLQRRLGFEIEMLALVDINGRPIPEKVALGTVGAHNVEMTVDHGPAVAADTPTPAYNANFSVPGMGAGGAVPLLLGPYDTPVGTQTRMAWAGGGADPRAAIPVNLLSWNTWANATVGSDRTRTSHPDNRAIVQIDQLLHQHDYPRLRENFESTAALSLLMALRTALWQWNAVNPNAGTRFGHPISNGRRTARFNALQGHVATLLVEVNQHLAYWGANLVPPAGMQFEYNPPGGAGWGPAHPQFQPGEGMGTDRYASILELVTPGGPGYEPETVPGRAAIIAAMQDAVNFANALVAAPATNNFTQRVPLGGVAGVNNVTNPGIHVGNPAQPNQTINASIQSTLAIDLAQIASFIKSTTAAAMNPQQLFTLKHHGDPVGHMGMPMARLAETELARAPMAARNVIRNRMVGVVGWGGNVTHLRGLLTLMCGYLMMGRHFIQPGGQILDKNLVAMLSRNDLGSVVFAELVPPAEQALVNTPLKRTQLSAAIIAECAALSGGGGFAAGNAVLNDPADTTPAGGLIAWNPARQQFIHNVLTGLPDGITANLGGFRTFAHGESVDPGGARSAVGGDYHRAGAGQREGAIFELRNMVPSDAMTALLNLDSDRFPSTEWVTLATYMCDLLTALNARTEAQSARDTRYRQATGLTHDEGANW